MEEVGNPPSGFKVSSFDKLVVETCRKLGATASPDEVIDLVQLRVLNAFVNQVSKDFTGRKLEEEEEEALKKISYSSSCDKEKQETFKETRSSSSRDVEHQRNKTSKLKIVPVAMKKKSNKKRKIGFHNKMSSRMKERIEKEGGCDMKLVIVKKMYKTDLSEHHDRLSIPVKQIEDISFLTEEEKRDVLENDRELDVKLMEPCGDKSSMVLVKWKLKTTDSLALRTSWNAVLGRNHEKHFKENDVIQLWSFRVDTGELWLAIDKIWDAPRMEKLETDTETETRKTNKKKKQKW